MKFLAFIFLFTVCLPPALFSQNTDPAVVEQEYSAAIKKGDQYYGEEKYDRALYEFETARKLKPAEKYPQERIKVINEVLDDQKTKNILFEVAVTSAEKWYKAGDYKRAKAEFENALRIDPTAQYPKDRLAQINKIWSDPEVDAKYAAAILHADDLFAQKSYVDAKAEYMVASDLKPYEQYPLDRIIAINEILANLQLLQDQYKSIIAKADGQFDNKEYDPARATYQDASNIKPDEAYPKNRIKEIDLILEKLKAEREAYDRIIAMADDYYLNKDFEKAKIEYEKAVAMKPTEVYGKNMIAKIDPQIAEMQRIQGEYDLAMTNANTLFQKNDYEGARMMFQKAGTLKPKETLPKDKIAEIDRILNSVAIQSEKEQQYDVAVRKADSLFALNDMELSRSLYVQASGVFPDRPYPKDKIAEIESLISVQKALEDAYAQAIEEGDRAFTASDYTAARPAYQKASTTKPTESYPKSKIAEIDGILAERNRIQQEYDKAITAADAYFDKTELNNARLKYVAASDLKPEEQYPKDRVSLIDRTLADKEALETGYKNAIVQADEMFTKKEYTAAKTGYQKALTFKPAEKHPSDRIAEIDRILAGIAATDQAYQESIAAGDAFFAEKNYSSALTEYQKAQKTKPEETYPGEKILQINQILTNLEAAEEGYKNAITQADKLFATKNYENALSFYVRASEIKPAEAYPQTRISELNVLLSDLQALEDAYAQAIEEGDRAFTASDYTAARPAYQKASTTKPTESYPKSKIAEIDGILAERNRIQQEYDKAITAADTYFDKTELSNARLKYVAASDLKPEEQYPKDRISLIDRTLADKEALETGYKNAIAQADEMFTKKEYTAAKNGYQQALTLKPAEKHPSDRIAEIDRILAGIAATDQAYQESIAAGDALFTEKNYIAAITEYQNAIKIKPGEVYPQQKVEEIVRIQTDIKANEEAYQKAIVQGDKLFAQQSYQDARNAYVLAQDIKPEEPYPQQKIDEIDLLLSDLKAKEDAYAQAIGEGDSRFASKEYGNARTAYEKASGIKPAESYPKSKISEIDRILAEIARIQKEYDAVIVIADRSFTNKEYTIALADYQKAQSLKPEEAYPPGQIAKINQILEEIKNLENSYASHISSGDDLLAKKEYEEALAEYQQALTLKPGESYPKNKITEIEGILAIIAASEKAYQQAVKAGDSLFSATNYLLATVEYQKASKAKPDELYPREKIKEISKIQADLKANEEAYQAAIALGDKLFTQQSYQDARNAYLEAKGIKPAESYPQQKIEEIDLLLSDLKAKEDAYAQALGEGDSRFASKEYGNARTAYEKASGIKPAESYPKSKIAEIDRILAEIARIQKEYDAAIVIADRSFTNKEYKIALTDYQKAQSLKPEEAYPPGQIAKINQILEEIKNLENSYTSHISSGDDLLAKKEYSAALAEYQQASALKPGEMYPKNKVSEIEAILAAIQARQKAYNDAVAKADGYFNAKEYEKAKLAYQDALTHDQGQSYPQDQVTRINGIMKEMELQKSFDATVAKADQFFGAKDYDNARTEYQKAINLKPAETYPQTRIGEINSILAANEQARMESYNKAIESGDSFFALQDYKSAKVQYQNAISINPVQQYPKDKLKEVEQILLDKEMELKKVYQVAVAKADNLYSQKILDEAIDAYMAAHEIKNDEVYPLNMINQIKKYIADHAIVDILNSSVIISNNTERKFDFQPVDIRQRKNNYVVMKARVLSESKPKVYLNYGKDATRSGGIVLKSIKDNEMNDYIIRVSAQDPWYRIDNTWLKLYSEGGDIEVSFIQISTAD